MFPLIRIWSLELLLRVTSPLSCSSNPAIILSNVDLPTPFCPISTDIFSDDKFRDSPSKIILSSYEKLSPFLCLISFLLFLIIIFKISNLPLNSHTIKIYLNVYSIVVKLNSET